MYFLYILIIGFDNKSYFDKLIITYNKKECKYEKKYLIFFILFKYKKNVF